MFIGEYSHTIDNKGRLAIPVKMRAKLFDGAVVTKGLDACLFIYPKNEWDAMARKLASLPISDKKARAFSRMMLAGAMEVEFDKQGRVLLPGYLRKYANLKSNAIIAGLYNRIEVWNEKAWNKYKDESNADSDEVSEHLSELGI